MYQIPLQNGRIVDNFAGGGGASCGIEQALNAPVNVAVNHDPEAIGMHTINHPHTTHLCEDVFRVKPRIVADGQKIRLAWFSPDCKHFSKAKGGKPREKKIRALAWIVAPYAALPEDQKPDVIVLENVEEFISWGPLLDDGQPDPARKGETFNRFVSRLRELGYKVEWRELKACDYGTPTIRKRFFMIARCDGLPIVWPAPTHGKKGSGLLPYRTAADCIDWSLPCQSIFGRKKPLAENTMRRVAKGIKRYVLDNHKPFIVTVNHTGEGFRGQSVDSPLYTMTQKNGFALVVPYLVEHSNASAQRTFPADEPLRTQCAQVKGGHFALCEAFLEERLGVKAKKPKGKDGLEASYIMKLRGENVGHGMDEPLHTVTSSGCHHAEVRAFLIKYYGADQDPRLEEPLHTVTTKDRFGLVTIHGQDYAIVDIRMRMLSPRELYRAQGFPDSYIIDHGIINGETVPLTKKAQVRMCGNSVCPPLAKAIVESNVVHTSLFNLKTVNGGY